MVKFEGGSYHKLVVFNHEFVNISLYYIDSRESYPSCEIILKCDLLSGDTIQTLRFSHPVNTRFKIHPVGNPKRSTPCYMYINSTLEGNEERKMLLDVAVRKVH